MNLSIVGWNKFWRENQKAEKELLAIKKLIMFGGVQKCLDLIELTWN